jgi:hypothetical protein
MHLPSEIQSIIISFAPHSNYSAVCKQWSKEIKNKQKIAVNIIELWYKYIHNNPLKINFINRYISGCHSLFISSIPDIIVKTLELNEILLDVLPVTRKRSDVRDWLLNLPLDEEELIPCLFSSIYTTMYHDIII